MSQILVGDSTWLQLDALLSWIPNFRLPDFHSGMIAGFLDTSFVCRHRKAILHVPVDWSMRFMTNARGTKPVK